MIDRYDEHKGPVRGLDFHHHQPLFVSGGDDAKIKVWNYKFRRCLFTLDAHEDYIRSTFFHRENPWIVSASDDQSIRIWNWQSRSRIAVLTGHTHYIMCAQFHPTKELILSASIDQTLRVWDISELKKKNKSKSGMSRDDIVTGLPDILTKTDYTVVPNEAHSVEINWCAFHPDPKRQLCLSAADDNYIKLWQIDERNSLRSVDILRGHFNNVSCATFITVQGKDFIISVSEDRTVKIWDIEKRCPMSTHRKENDRFWTCAAHPRENIYAAGHDSGVILFKLEKERPAFCVYKDYILYVRRRQICRYNMRTNATKPIQTLMPRTEMSQYYQRLHCYSYDEKRASNIIVSVRSNKSVYDLYTVQGEAYGTGKEPRRKPGLTAIFIGPNRIAILDDSKHVYFRINDEDRRPKIPIQAEEIFEAGPGKLFTKHKVDGSHAISLWDIEKGCILNTIKVDAKSVISDDSRNYIACVGPHKITICDGQLNLLSVVQEQRKIKSVIWDENGVLVYTTPVQIKYALTNGLVSTIMTVKQTLYLVTIRDQNIYSIERTGNVSVIPIDTREFKFKQAVISNNKLAILQSIRSLGTLGRCEIAFLVQKAHPGLALKFVNDHESRFRLALRAFDIDEASKSAAQLNKRHYWEQLAQTAMQIGNVKAVERAYIELKQPYKLAMLYFTCNQRDKMKLAREMARKLRDNSTEFLISLLLKDFTECVQIIRRRGHSALAYISALNHGLKELAAEIRASGEIDAEQLAKLPKIDDIQPRLKLESNLPNISNSPFENWPLLTNESDKFDGILNDEPEEAVDADEVDEWGDTDWGDEEWGDEQNEESNTRDNRQKSQINEKLAKEVDQPKDLQVDGDDWQDDFEPLEDLIDDEDDFQPDDNLATSNQIRR